jgi:hypothetical protein
MQNYVDKRRKKRGVLTAIENFTNYRQNNTWKKQPLFAFHRHHFCALRHSMFFATPHSKNNSVAAIRVPQ